VKFVYSNGDIDKIMKTEILFSRFVRHNLRYVISQIRSNILKTDDDVINFILKTSNNNNNNNKNNKNNKNGGNKHTQKSKLPRRNDWEYMADTITFKTKQFLHPNQNDNMKYLDIGCGDGNKTKLFGTCLNIDQSNLYGCDITTWGPYKSTKDFGFNFSLIENGKLNYDDSMFDIITAILTLHHVEKLGDFLAEIYRVLKPNGVLILIEHNIYDDVERMIVDVQHLFFGAFVDNNLEFAKNEMYTKCYNQMEWEFIFNKYNMKNLHNDMLFPQLENRLRYDSLYYGIFQK
jgi:ubiquinone/menaquinone biosynthesis C-methylase UbiE